MHVFLETERLFLRRFTDDDVENLVELDSDPDVMKYINGGTPTPREEIESDVLPAFLSYYERGDTYGFWAIEEKSSGDFIGWVHYRPDNDADPDVPELGYRLLKSAWGQGYATEASRAVVDNGFAEHGVARVTASAYATNRASCKIMQKLGMKLVRSFRVTPKDGISLEYALDRDAWEAQNARNTESAA